MFHAKLNYLTAGMALVFLLLIGRFSFMQVSAYEKYNDQAANMRTSMTLLPPNRADIMLKDGSLAAHTESVWDIYIDLEAFASPKSMALRAHNNPERYMNISAKAFSDETVEVLTKAKFSSPASRRRFFLMWQLRNHPAAKHDFDVCASRLCMAIGMSRPEFDAQISVVLKEVNALTNELDNPETASRQDVSLAWNRAKPALRDPDYWERIRRFPKSVRFAPVLKARLDWLKKEADYIESIIEKADDSEALLRRFCYEAADACREKAAAIKLDADTELKQNLILEEHNFWLRLATQCDNAYTGNFSLTERLETLTTPDGLIQAVTDRLDRLVKRTIQRYQADWNKRWSKYEFDSNPLRLMRNAPRDIVELLKVNADILPGVICKRRAARRYHFPRELVHVLGSVGQPDPAELNSVVTRPSFGDGLDEFIETWFDGDKTRFETRFYNTVAQQDIGKSGVERFYDEQLTGLWGARSFIRDAAGRTRSIEFEQAPVNYEPLTLTIDMELQRDIMRTVEKWEPRLAAMAQKKVPTRWNRYKWQLRGAAVVLDIETGDVLAMVSFPDYDPQRLSGRSAKDKAYQRMLKAEELREKQKGYKHWLKNSRMMNKATVGRYAPGSTFKVLTAVGLLEDRVVSLNETIDEPEKGGWIYSRSGKRLAKTNHGAGDNVNMYDALEKSSNGYFYTFSQEFTANPYDSLQQLQGWAETFGIGRYLNSDFSMNHAQFPQRANPGDLAQFAIGQGQFVCTPMEIARLYATIANRGTLHAPRLSSDWRTWPETLDVSDETWDIVHEGMRRVVFGDHGTARMHQVLKDIKCAGKTGTAQNGKTTPDHAWFAGFAPHDKPKVAFVMLASYSDLYGADVSPVIGECVQRYLERMNK